MVLSSSQLLSHHHDEGKPDILLPESPLSPTAAANVEPCEVKVEVPSSSSSSSLSQETMKTQGSEARLSLTHWLREALSVLQHKQNREEEREVDEQGLAAGKDEWREAGALLRKIGDLLDGCTWVSFGTFCYASIHVDNNESGCRYFCQLKSYRQGTTYNGATVDLTVFIGSALIE